MATILQKTKHQRGFSLLPGMFFLRVQRGALLSLLWVCTPKPSSHCSLHHNYRHWPIMYSLLCIYYLFSRRQQRLSLSCSPV